MPGTKMKTCSKCNTEKDLDQFYKSSKMKDGLQSSCKCCNDLATAKSRATKPEKYRKRRQELRAEYVQQFFDWKRTQSCLVCGETEESCLDLHHLNPSEKELDISTASRRWSWEKLFLEIDKCIVVCSNCHRKIHAGVIRL